MEKNVATEIIGKVFNKGFNLEEYTVFMRNLLNDFDESRARDWAQGNYIYEAYREHISRFKRIGLYNDPDGIEVELLVIETKTTAKLERARTMLRNFVIKRLQDKNRDYALAAFYSKEDDGADWRFSFIKIEHESFKSEKGKIKTRKELTPAKRYSFLVGEYEHAYTAQKQLLPVIQNDYSHPTVEELEDSFSIDKVTDDFFEQYKELYIKVSEHIKNQSSIVEILNESGVEVARFAKKLLGQIVFLYFLQKKGWLGVSKDGNMGEGRKNYIQQQFEIYNKNGENYFSDFLQFLFYEALAKEHNDEGIKYYYKKLKCLVPFLNGGLFEADYDWKNVDIEIPNSLFWNDDKTKHGDGSGILNVFDRYNFTIKEDEPLEKEVAVDPEMLGKVFENMLEITERKSKGAFYTPREIVHYMCQESLIQYLNNSINDAPGSFQPIDDNQLAMFGGSTSKKGQAKLEIEHKGKTLVPLTELEDFIHKGHLAIENDWNVTNKGRETDTYKYRMPDAVIQHADLIDKKLTDIKICDPAIGSGAFPVGILHELVIAQKALLSHLSPEYRLKKLKTIGLSKKDYDQDREKYTYRIKRHAIQESIYGVDLDASAIDIARLRLWLSLIVDEDNFYNIEALPNLDYKIVQGNSLIGLPENGMRDLNAEAELEKLKSKFFNETDEKGKKQLRTQINDKIRQVLDSAEPFTGYKIDFDFKLFFSEVWHSKKGFDIVIGNPPYDVYEGNRKNEIEIIEKISLFEKAKGGKHNAFKLFLAISIYLQNTNGILCEIFQNSFLADNSSKSIRKHFLCEENIVKIDSFPERDDVHKRVFKQVKMSVCILTSIRRKLPKYNYTLNIWHQREMQTSKRAIFNNIETLGIDVQTNAIPSVSQEELLTLKKISKNNRFNSVANCFQGEINLSSQKKYLTTIPSTLTKPLLKGAGIQKWHFPAKMSQGEIEYVYYKQYLDENKGIRTRHHEKRRIVTQGITGVDEKDRIKAMILEPGVFCGHSVNYLIFTSDNSNIKFYLALLNSEILNWYFKVFSTNSNVNSYEINGLPLVGFKSQHNPSQVLVDYCLFMYSHFTKGDRNIIRDYFNALIDGVCYEIYFSDELAKSKKTFLEYLSDLKPINENMSDEQKLSTIQHEFNRLYDPNHPVRNNLETLDSIEEIRIIKAALK